MKVSRNSQFYQFLDTNIITQGWRKPPNLCPFMRRVVWGFALNIIIGLLLCSTLVGVLLVIPMELLGYDVLGQSVWLHFCSVLGIISYMLVIGVGLVLGVEHVSNRPMRVVRTAVTNSVDKVTSTDSYQLVHGWYQAVHDKTCPYLEFTD